MATQFGPLALKRFLQPHTTAALFNSIKNCAALNSLLFYFYSSPFTFELYSVELCIQAFHVSRSKQWLALPGGACCRKLGCLKGKSELGHSIPYSARPTQPEAAFHNLGYLGVHHLFLMGEITAQWMMKQVLQQFIAGGTSEGQL